ncbi:PD-(D/E)XK nuclease family protein [Leucobacter sp. W1478]|uniref:PD-(D/E)XK nuclease family protein n=1 Tax=Leucobacter sp. W1478 TaxID=3439065 RepID=UPI003F3D6F90
MITHDPSQQLALALDPARHARVLGAPGSGKSEILLELTARHLRLPGWRESDVWVLGANREVAAGLRSKLERRIDGALGGTPVRTAASFAFALLQRLAATEGRTPQRLLTGTAHDEAVARAVEAALSAGRETASLLQSGGLHPDILRGEAFRAELREFSRVLDDFAINPEELSARLRTQLRESGGAHSLLPDPELAEHWIVACDLVAAVHAHLRASRPDELSSSELLKAAGEALASEREIAVPRLVLIDDAQELGEGELALLVALVGRGTRVWAFGDPDISTGAFHGERVRILAGVGAELARRGAARLPAGFDEQLVVLTHVYRQGETLRSFVQQLSTRVGTAGVGQQRAARAAERAACLESRESAEPSTEAQRALEGRRVGSGDSVQFATVASSAEQLGVIAHRLRRRRLGLDGGIPVAWRDMAVICRSRGEVIRAARMLAGHQVPTNVAAGGVVLRDHQLVRELILVLQHALGYEELTPRDLLDLLGGVIGGLDPIALRRLRGELRLQENRRARAEERAPIAVDELIALACATPGTTPVVDSRAGRSLGRLGSLIAAARAMASRGGTPREVLWEIWQGTGLAQSLQNEALEGRGSRADEAHQSLDAVLGLFFALQRHEEQNSEVPVPELLRELLVSSVPRDSLAARSERDVVTVTTPQGVVGREFRVVCVLGPQEGSWPNLRSRGSLLGVISLERWLRGEAAVPPSRKDTLHDELRLLVHSCARAREEILAVAISDEDSHPSAFFGFGREYAVVEPLPSSRLTLRGAVAEMRRRLTANLADEVALRSLVALAQAGAPGAHPSEWYGVRPPSTERPLVDLAGEPDARVSVSPSRLEDAERCPLDWAISTLGGASAGVSQGIGTLLHRALETAEGAVSAEKLVEVVFAEWGGLVFEAEWESARKMELVKDMARGLADYLAEFESSNRRVIGREAKLRLEIDRARIVGVADRLEARELADGRVEISVVDLKTGGKLPPGPELPANAQLQAYQMGLIHQAFDLEDGASPADTVNGGARLLFVHPDVRTTRGAEAGSTFRQPTQPLLDDEGQRLFTERVSAVAGVMAGGTFVARVEHHCSDPHAVGGSCRLHIIPAVSHA